MASDVVIRGDFAGSALRRESRTMTAPRGARPSGPVPVVGVRQKVVDRLEQIYAGLVHPGGRELFVELDEPEDVPRDSFAGVTRARAGAQDERPVARLGQHEFARGLVEGAAGERI